MSTNKPERRLPIFVKPYNAFVRSFAGRFLYALLRHQGRKSGKIYETPVMAWPTKSGMIIPLAWGSESDWYRNLLAANGGEVQINGRWYRCADPTLITRDQAISLLPPSARLAVYVSPLPVKQFVLLRQIEAARF